MSSTPERGYLVSNLLSISFKNLKSGYEAWFYHQEKNRLNPFKSPHKFFLSIIEKRSQQIFEKWKLLLIKMLKINYRKIFSCIFYNFNILYYFLLSACWKKKNNRFLIASWKIIINKIHLLMRLNLIEFNYF